MILNQIYGFQLISNFALGETMITSAEEIIKVQKREPEIRYICLGIILNEKTFELHSF